VAHDFNNLLMAIFNYHTLAMHRLEPGHAARAPLSQAQEAAERAATLTRQLLAFARKQIVRPRVFSPRQVVTDLAPMLRRLIGDDLVLKVEAAQDTGNVNADPTQLDQVIMNLVVNARDAMPSGGTVTLATANVALDQEVARTRARPGPYVAITVTDTGVGMTPEVKSRLFEPFFTTKPPGKGTGLGLATCHGIVKQSGGHITVESEAGRGTRISVFLPRVDDKVDKAVAAAVQAPRGGSETILLVEDSAMIRELMTDALRRAGYQVAVAPSGPEAVRLADEQRGRIDLLVTDIVMPEMSGVELAGLIVQKHASARVIFISGYAEETVLVPGLADHHSVFIAKPFSTNTLLTQVRAVLDQPSIGRPA
jgi:CheY-like chemotaxis protein